VSFASGGGTDSVVANCTFDGNVLGNGQASTASDIYNVSCVGILNCLFGGPGPGPSPTACTVEGAFAGADPRFVRPGTFDFTRFREVDLSGEVEFPDFLVDAGDLHLQEDSPAVDAGTLEGAPTADFEGNPRPRGRGVDAGAYESPWTYPAPFRRGDANADGSMDLADPIAILFRLFMGAEPLRCPKAADADDSGALDLADPIVILEHLFRSGPALMRPFAVCGMDPTEDPLGCDDFPPCD